MKVEETSGLILNPIQKKKTQGQGEEKGFRQIMDEVILEKGAQGSGGSRPPAGLIPEGVQIIADPAQNPHDDALVLAGLRAVYVF